MSTDCSSSISSKSSTATSKDKGRVKTHRKILVVTSDEETVPLKKKRVEIVYYHNGRKPGSFIRDAVTGLTTSYKIGSKKEELFFSVLVIGPSGYSHKLFFESPVDFEKLFHTAIH